MLLLFGVLHFSEPFLVFNREVEESFHRVSDVCLHGDFLYTIDRDDAAIHQFDQAGRYRQTIAGSGQAPGELSLPSDLLSVGEELWVLDIKAFAIHIFRQDRFVRKIPLEQVPTSLFRIGESIIVAPFDLEGSFLVLNRSGETQRRFKIENTDFAEPPAGQMRSLWRSIQAVPGPGEHIIIGMLFMDQMAAIDLQGRLTQVWDCSDYLFEHGKKIENKGSLPVFFSAISYSEGPTGHTYLAASEEGESRSCRILYRMDVAEKKVVKRITWPDHLKRIRYFTEQDILAFVQHDDSVALYRGKDADF